MNTSTEKDEILTEVAPNPCKFGDAINSILSQNVRVADSGSFEYIRRHD